MSLKELSESPVMRDFVVSSRKVETECKSCSVGFICRGGCRRERDYSNDALLKRNIYCEGRKRFFTCVLKKIEEEQR